MTILVGDSDRWQRTPRDLAILARLREQGPLGATVTRGIAGFGGRADRRHRRHRAGVARRSRRASGVLRSRWSDAARLEVQHARAHRAAELMRTPVVIVHESAPVAEALALSVARHIERLPVVDEDGRLVGIVSRPALLAASLDLASAPAEPSEPQP